ncbi:YggS family pyridoxal phosphate-dependent enzyme [Commensalibacter oyaizuii]|uniref:Pyridoxal phosphate homeostasis protein n=1 Tax=Commensalibacter oyaizuii TaxID=3043873 RepID=A0ABT6Q4Y7_9PROT|nr:YggS family pyridoxal phosphate-dependent enzyme [Commensalibacter sp. TBRC 16381]MDI2091559.1 YggS family pyridoxal phosphate-dependent enzyme [Commensalibacter sp. TBRC 16381]
MNPFIIQQNLNKIHERISHAAKLARRNPNDIKLVAVSKFHPIEAIQTVINQGHVIFGENRIQEAKTKFTLLRQDVSDLHLHIIGPIQTNKIIDAVKIASVIETIDRPALLLPLEKAMDKTGLAPKLFIQINIGQEPQKSGVLPHDADEFITLCLKRFGNQIQGVMGIPPYHQDPTPYFQKLATFARKYHLPEISMGMSADFETAIACGATIVRVGSAIFGERPVRQL